MVRSSLGTTLRRLAMGAALLATPAIAVAQNAVVRGTVRSDGGEPIVGANVYFVELNIQTATSDAGRFTITVPGDRVRGQQLMLRARAVGYRPASRQVTLVAGEQTVEFQLVQDVNRLEEIVVTGVMEGTEAARVPFSVARVDLADVPVPPTDPLRLLAGRVPGATVISASGRPGASPAVLLRGPTSINAQGRSQNPLFIVDGVIISGDLPDINPSDIENVEVVKGAAASSLYGARAGNGVIQITTRSGRRSADGMTFNTRAEAGANDIERDFPLSRQTSLIMDSRNERFCVNRAGAPLCSNTIDWNTEVARINNEPGDAALAPASFPLDPGAAVTGAPLRNAFQAQLWPGRTYSAVDQAVDPGAFGQLTLDATGRFGGTQFFSSFGYLDQGGAIRFLEGFERYSGRVNVDQRIGDDFSLTLRSYYSQSTADGLDQDGGGGQAFFRLTRVPAIANILARDTLGRLYVRTNLQNQGNQNENPLQTLHGQQDVLGTDRFLGGMTLRYTPSNALDFEVNGSYDLQNQTQDFFRDKGFRTTSSAPATNNGFIRQFASRTEAFNTSANATLRHRFGSSVQVRWNARTLYEQQDFMSRQGSGNQLGAVGVPQLNNATAGQTVTSASNSVRQIGLFAGVNFDILDGRYIVEGLVRRDGTSLFGADNRWATFGRFSLAWRPSAESWWFGGDALNDLKLRFSRGSAGGRPRFEAQYETFGVTTAGPVLQTAGNSQLRPEITVDNEFGADMELFRRIGVQLTRAVSETRDQILLVPLPVEAGFGQQWRNAGTLQNRTWELAVNLPLVTRRDVSWSTRFTYDRTRTTISELDVPPFRFGSLTQNTTQMFQAAEGERYGTFYGRAFARSCSDLPAAFQTDCGGATTSFQFNDEGYLVWVGQGNSWRDGITRNLYQTSLPAGATTPWGVGFNFGMPIVVRDTACVTTPNPSCPAQQRALGNALPDWSFAVSSNLQIGRLTLFGLLQGVMGREVYNQGRHWSHLDFIMRDVDQRDKSVETAKPIGYYYRAGLTDGFGGIGGFYDLLAANSHFVEDASYAKLRELMVSYNVGPVSGIGNWTLSLVGRNLFTITSYTGFDPEVGQPGGLGNSAAINAVDAFNFPNTRSFTFALSTSF